MRMTNENDKWKWQTKMTNENFKMANENDKWEWHMRLTNENDKWESNGISVNANIFYDLILLSFLILLALLYKTFY